MPRSAIPTPGGPREEGITVRVYRVVFVRSLPAVPWPEDQSCTGEPCKRRFVWLFRRRTRSLHAEAGRRRGFRARFPAGDEVLDRCAAVLAGPLRLALAEVAAPGFQARPLAAVGVAAASPTAVLGHAALEAKAATDGTRAGDEAYVDESYMKREWGEGRGGRERAGGCMRANSEWRLRGRIRGGAGRG